MSGKGANKKGGHDSSSKRSSSEEIFLCVSVAVSGRSTVNGSILSLAAVAVTADREILGLYSSNLSPLPGSERLSHPDVVGYWQSRRPELEAVAENPQPPLKVFQELQQFCKSVGGKCTLVASPLLSVYGWLTHYWNVLMPKVAMPWGFSGLCARSFAAGTLGVSMQALSKCAAYVEAHEGLDTNGVPRNDAFVVATMFSNIWRRSFEQQQQLQKTAGAAVPPPTSGVVVPLRCAPSAGQYVAKLVADHHHHQAQQAAAMADAPSPAAVVSTTAAVSSSSSFTFREYPSITDPMVDPTFQDEVCHRFSDEEWVVTEKVHGSNFSIICDGGTLPLHCAKRTALLQPNDELGFYYYLRLVKPLEPAVLKCYELVKRELANADVAAIAVVGEIAGGEYVHPQVPFDLRGIKVQNGVQYYPNNIFYAFDIGYVLRGTGQQEEEEEGKPISSSSRAEGRDWKFLDFDTAQRIFDVCGVFCTRPLLRGTAAEALSFSPIMESTIPSRLGLPAIPANYAEGVVVRPVHDKYVGETRVMAKLKHPAFSEFSKTPGDTPPAELLIHFAKNENRYASVTSKMTLEERNNKELVIDAMVKDALSDVTKLHATFQCSDDLRKAAAAAVEAMIAQVAATATAQQQPAPAAAAAAAE